MIDIPSKIQIMPPHSSLQLRKKTHGQSRKVQKLPESKTGKVKQQQRTQREKKGGGGVPSKKAAEAIAEARGKKGKQDWKKVTTKRIWRWRVLRRVNKASGIRI